MFKAKQIKFKDPCYSDLFCGHLLLLFIWTEFRHSYLWIIINARHIIPGVLFDKAIRCISSELCVWPALNTLWGIFHKIKSMFKGFRFNKEFMLASSIVGSRNSPHAERVLRR